MSWRQSFLWSLHQLHWGVHWVHLLLHPKPFISTFPSYLFQIRVRVDSIFYLSQIEDQRENNLTKTKTIPAKITVISIYQDFLFLTYSSSWMFCERRCCANKTGLSLRLLHLFRASTFADGKLKDWYFPKRKSLKNSFCCFIPFIAWITNHS